MVNHKTPDERRATLAELAISLGVSVSTVSRALNKPDLLSAETVERVLKAAEQMRYRPNFLAKHLRIGRTQNILVVMPRLSPFFLEMFRGIEEAASMSGYFAMIVHGGRDPVREGEYFDQVSSGRADGLLMLSSGLGERPRTNKYKPPAVVSVLDADFNGEFPSVRVDHRKGAVAATQHLIALGHRHIAHITGNMMSPMALQRREGFHQAMQDAGLAVDPRDVVDGGFTPEDGERAMEQILPRRPSAVFAANDESAVGAIKAIRSAGLRVPDDISVIGFDDQRLSRIFSPALTTVHVPAFELGYLGMQTLGDLIAGVSRPQDQLLETHIVERETTARPAR